MADEQKASGGGKGKIIVIIIVVLLLLIAGLVVAFMFLTQEPKDGAGGEMGADGAPQAQSEMGGDTNARYLRIGPIFQLDQFIVNLLSQGGRRYLKINLGLEMTTPVLENELNAKRPLVRDVIIGVLASKSAEDLSTTRGRDKMKEEIVQMLNESLVDGKIRNVFISDMAIQ